MCYDRTFAQGEVLMSLRIGDVAPDFTADTTHGLIRFHEWLGAHWGVLFSHHKDFTPICTSELGDLARRQGEFEQRDVKLIGLSMDEIDDHFRWLADIAEITGGSISYPLIADDKGTVAALYDMHPGDGAAGLMPRGGHTVRSLFLIDPEKRVQAVITYPLNTGRNFAEILRLIDSAQLTAKHSVATPAGWEPGDDVVIASSLSNERAHQEFPEGWRTVKPYIRVIPQPESARARTKGKAKAKEKA